MEKKFEPDESIAAALSSLRRMLRAEQRRLRSRSAMGRAREFDSRAPTDLVTLTLSPIEAAGLKYALSTAAKAPDLKRSLHQMRQQRRRAALFLLRATSTPDAFRRVAEYLGVWKPKGVWHPYRLPIDFMGVAFDDLTEKEGDVLVRNEVSWILGLKGHATVVRGCPLDPVAALHRVKFLFEQKKGKVDSLRKRLQRRKNEIAKLSESERALKGPYGLTLPKLLKLPYGETVASWSI